MAMGLGHFRYSDISRASGLFSEGGWDPVGEVGRGMAKAEYLGGA